MATAQQKWFAFQANRNLSRSGGAADTVSAEAQAVLDRMTALSAGEEAAIVAFVDASVADGNWALIEEFYCLGLNSTDWLTGFVSKTATNSGATNSTAGATFAGAQSIDTKFDPAVDGVSITQDNIVVGVLLSAYDVNNKDVFGCPPTNTLSMRYNATPLLKFKVNSTNTMTGHGYTADSMMTLARTDASTTDAYVNGALTGGTGGTGTQTSTGIGTGDIQLGENGNGSGNMTGVIASFVIGVGVGFNHLAHNNNVKALMAAL